MAVGVAVLHRARAKTSLRLVRDAHGNEALVLRGTLSGAPMLFMIDTAYAGAPVLSTSYLAAHSDACVAGVETAYRDAVDRVRRVSVDERHAALARFLRASGCRAFTSGCTMRLMGIGTTTEAHADLLLCPALKLRDAPSADDGDVFVTNPLPGSVHILTMDYLLHRAPCVLAPARARATWRAPPWMRAWFDVHVPRMVGGAMSVEMRVGGAVLRVVVDTGAAAALSLSKDAASKVIECARGGGRAFQRGVNGERVCSDAFAARVHIGKWDAGIVEVFANAASVEAADGYAGMGLLRAFDLWLAPGEIGFRPSGLPARGSPMLSAGQCDTSSLPPCARGAE